MNKYVLADFESEFVETNAQVLRVICDTLDEEYYDMLIDTYSDPYKIYYSTDKPKDEESFREALFDYLKEKYPEYFN